MNYRDVSAVQERVQQAKLSSPQTPSTPESLPPPGTPSLLSYIPSPMEPVVCPLVFLKTSSGPRPACRTSQLCAPIRDGGFDGIAEWKPTGGGSPSLDCKHRRLK